MTRTIVLAIAFACGLLIAAVALIAPVFADDSAKLRSLTLEKGDKITHAAGNLWRIQDSHGRVKGYIERDPAYPDQARVRGTDGDVQSTVDLDSLIPDADETDTEESDDESE